MAPSPRGGSRHFLVELPDDGLDVLALTERSRAIDLEGARLLRTVYVPEDGRCFLLVEAAGRTAAVAAARLLGCRPARVTRTVGLGRHRGSDKPAAQPPQGKAR